MESIGEILKGLNPTLAQTIQRGYERALEENIQEFYNCEACKDIGVIVHNYPIGHKYQGKQWGEVCKCKVRARQEYNLKMAGIDKDRTLEDFKTDRYEEPFYMDMVKDILAKFIQNHKGKNLFITGNTGLGKTLASKIIVAELMRKDIDILYKRANKILDELMAFKMADMQDYTERQKALEEVEVLVLDDIGTEALSGSKLVELFNLIDERQIKGKSTIISSNLSIDDIETKYNDRIASRIKGYYQIVEFKGKDLRYGE